MAIYCTIDIAVRGTVPSSYFVRPSTVTVRTRPAIATATILDRKAASLLPLSASSTRGYRAALSWPRRRYALHGRAANGERVDPHRRLADADGYALPFLAAGADAGVKRHVVADHGNLGQHIRAVAD